MLLAPRPMLPEPRPNRNGSPGSKPNRRLPPRRSSEDLPIAPPTPPPHHRRLLLRPPIRRLLISRISTIQSATATGAHADARKDEAVVATRDTPRGLVITIIDSGFDNGAVRSNVSDTLARLAPVLMQPGVHVSVEGFSDTAAGTGMAERRAEAVRDVLASRGLSSSMMSTRNLADSRLLTSNATAEGRMQNRRVEIVTSPAIGSQPLWDRSYNVTLR